MKKKIIAAAVAAMTASSASAVVLLESDASQLTLNGRLTGQGQIQDSSFSDNSSGRLGVVAQTALTEQWQAFAQYELEVSATERSQALDTRLALLGVDSRFGSFSYGRQSGAYSLVSDMTDQLLEFGGDGSGVGTDSFGTGRSDGVLKYSAGFGNWDLAVSGQLNNSQVDNERERNGSFGFAVAYSMPTGVTFAAAANSAQGAYEPVTMAVLSTSYKINRFYAAFAVSESLNSGTLSGEQGREYTGFEAVVRYDVSDNLTAVTGYNRHNLLLDGKVQRDTGENYFTFGSQYRFNEQFRGITEYKLNRYGSDELVLVARFDF